MWYCNLVFVAAIVIGSAPVRAQDTGDENSVDDPGLDVQADDPGSQSDTESVPAEKPKPGKKVKDADKDSKSVKTSRKKVEYFVGTGLMSPEVLPFEFNLRIKKRFMFRGYIAPPTVRFRMPVTVPEYSLNATLFKVYSPQQQLNADITYGPHYGTEAYYLPWQGRFYFGGGFGIRQITASMDDSLEFFVCQVNDKNCGKAANPASVHITGSATTTTILGRSALGWLFKPAKNFYVNVIGIGLSVPLKSTLDQDLNVELENTRLPPWLNNVLSASVNRSLDPYEASIAQSLYDAYASKYDKYPMPMAGVIFGFAF
jgi:hypothetical protein